MQMPLCLGMTSIIIDAIALTLSTSCQNWFTLVFVQLMEIICFIPTSVLLRKANLVGIQYIQSNGKIEIENTCAKCYWALFHNSRVDIDFPYFYIVFKLYQYFQPKMAKLRTLNNFWKDEIQMLRFIRKYCATTPTWTFLLLYLQCALSSESLMSSWIMSLTGWSQDWYHWGTHLD